MIVVDASALADALVDDGPVGDSSRAALARDPHPAAPSHLLVEVVSVIRGLTLGGKLAPSRAREAMDALPMLVIDQMDIARLIDRMGQLRNNLSAYDAAYVATAEALDCPLLTSDSRLADAHGIHCDVHAIAKP